MLFCTSSSNFVAGFLGACRHLNWQRLCSLERPETDGSHPFSLIRYCFYFTLDLQIMICRRELICGPLGKVVLKLSRPPSTQHLLPMTVNI